MNELGRPTFSIDLLYEKKVIPRILVEVRALPLGKEERKDDSNVGKLEIIEVLD